MQYTCIWFVFIGLSNQRTSGPVNVHLTPGPGIYFNAFIHVYSPRAGTDNPLGTNVDVHRKPLSLCPFCYMYIAPGQGQKTPWWQTFGVNRKPLSLRPFVASFFEFWFYTHFLMFFHMYIAPGWGQTTLCGQNPDVNRKALSLCPFVASFKKNIFEVWCYTISFHVFLCMYIDPGPGQTTPWRQNFYININLLSLWSFAVSFFH